MLLLVLKSGGHKVHNLVTRWVTGWYQSRDLRPHLIDQPGTGIYLLEDCKLVRDLLTYLDFNNPGAATVYKVDVKYDPYGWKETPLTSSNQIKPE